MGAGGCGAPERHDYATRRADHCATTVSTVSAIIGRAPTGDFTYLASLSSAVVPLRVFQTEANQWATPQTRKQWSCGESNPGPKAQCQVFYGCSQW